MENPNEYDDDEFARWSTSADDVIVSLWEAGASISDVEDVVENALANAGVKAKVSIVVTN